MSYAIIAFALVSFVATVRVLTHFVWYLTERRAWSKVRVFGDYEAAHAREDHLVLTPVSRLYDWESDGV